MRAVVCKELGPVEKLVLDTDWQVGAPGPDEVVIDVKAGDTVLIHDNVFHRVHNNTDVGLKFICVFDGGRNH